MTAHARTALAALASTLAALSLAACGKPLLYAEVEIPSATVLLAQQTFPSTVLPAIEDQCPPGSVVTPGASCLQRTFAFDLGNDFRDLTEDAVEFDLRLLDLGITLTASDPLDPLEPIGDFRDIEYVVVGVDGSASGLPSNVLATYRRSAADPTPQTIVVGASSNIDLGQYVQGGTISVYARLEFRRDIPAFTADVLSEFYLKALLDYGKLGGIY